MNRRAKAYLAVRRSEAIERNEAYEAFSAACLALRRVEPIDEATFIQLADESRIHQIFNF